MCARIQRTIIVAASLALLGCATPAQGFGAATLAFAQGEEALRNGQLQVAVKRHQEGIELTRKLVAEFPEDQLVKRVAKGGVKVGPYTYETIVESLAPRAALWLKHGDSVLARAFLEAETVTLHEERIEVLVSIAESMAEAGHSGPAKVVLRVAMEDAARLSNPTERAWAKLNLARGLSAAGDSEAALTEIWAVLDALEAEPFVPPSDVGEMLSELLEWCEAIDDNEIATPILERVGEIAAISGPEDDADFVLEEAAFMMARRGDCMAAQFMAESLLSLDPGDPCDCEFDEDGSADSRARLELLFDIFDECAEADPEAALILLDDAAMEASELGWHDFLSDVAWGYASLKYYDQALEAARLIPDALPRIDALLAVVEELPDDESEGGPEALTLLQEAAAIDLSASDPALRPRYHGQLSTALAAHGDATRAREQARLAFEELARRPKGKRGQVILVLVLLSPQLIDKEKKALVKMAIDEAEGQSLLPARIQALRSGFDAWLAIGDSARAIEFLGRAVAIAKAAVDLEDESFWCEAAVGYTAAGASGQAGELLDLLSPDALRWCLVSLAGSIERKELDPALRKRITEALAQEPQESAPTSALDEPPQLPCDKAIDEALKTTVAGPERIHSLLELAPRCEPPPAPAKTTEEATP